MTPGFNANVPARKPRTQLGRVISELTSEPRTPEDAADAAAPLTPTPTSEPPRVGPVRAAPAPSEAVTTAKTGKKAAVSAGPRVAGGREHVARLRERLDAAAQPASGVAEPKRTAAAVRDMVDGLRARLESSARERSELAAALEQAQAALARAEADLQKERRARAAVEVQAEERGRIADEAVAEAEALAAERDQVLRDLAEHRRLDEEQSSLLMEAEAVLARRDAERAASAREVAEARELAELRTADVADLEARLQDEAVANARVEARCKELEAEVARLKEAREALESIEAMVARGR